MQRWAKAQRAWITAAERSLEANRIGVECSRAIAKAELAAAAAGEKLVAIQAAALREVRRGLRLSRVYRGEAKA